MNFIKNLKVKKCRKNKIGLIMDNKFSKTHENI